MNNKSYGLQKRKLWSENKLTIFSNPQVKWIIDYALELEATIAEQKDAIEGGVLVATALSSKVNLLERSVSAQKHVLGELRADNAKMREAAQKVVDYNKGSVIIHPPIEALAKLLEDKND